MAVPKDLTLKSRLPWVQTTLCSSCRTNSYASQHLPVEPACACGTPVFLKAVEARSSVTLIAVHLHNSEQFSSYGMVSPQWTNQCRASTAVTVDNTCSSASRGSAPAGPRGSSRPRVARLFSRQPGRWRARHIVGTLTRMPCVFATLAQRCSKMMAGGVRTASRLTGSAAVASQRLWPPACGGGASAVPQRTH